MLSCILLAVLLVGPAYGQKTLSLEPTAELTAGEGALRVLLESQGTERQLGFSVGFDPAVLTWTGWAPGSDVSASWLTFDTSLVSTGRVGVLVTPPAGTLLAVGTRELVRLGFRALVAGPVSTNVDFASQPLVQFVSFSGVASAVTFTGRQINVGSLPASPLFLSPTATRFYVGLPGEFAVRAAANPAPVYALSAGSLPTWATLDAATGRLTGTPTSTAGSPFAFTLRASHGSGTSATQIVTLTVDPAPTLPVVAVPPRGLAALPGQAVAFSPIVTGSAPLRFQWKRDGVPITTATAAELSLQRVDESSAGNYTLDVSNAAGVTTSPSAALVIGGPGTVRAGDFGMPLLSLTTVFASQFAGARLSVPAAVKLAGLTVEFSRVSGSLFLAVVPLATTTSLPIGGGTSTTPFNSGEVVFQTTFTLPSGFVGTAAIPLNLDLAPGLYGFVLGSGQFGATGSASVPNYAYKSDNAGFLWNGPPGGSFRWIDNSFQQRIAVVTSGHSAAGPEILLPPAPVAVAAGSKAAFAVVATGAAPLSYQWKKHGVALSGATNSTYFIDGVQAGDTANYEVVVSNSAGSVTSRAVPLSVGDLRPLELALAQPPYGSSVVAGVAQSLSAVASSSLAAIAAVQFLADGVPLGPPVVAAPYSIEWTPGRRASSVLTARANDSAGRVIEAFPSLVTILSQPVFESPPAARFIVGRPGAFSVAISGAPAPAFTTAGLPSWVAFNSTTGELSGTPSSVTGSPFTFTLAATNGVGAPVTQTFILTVQPGHSADVSPADGALNLAELLRVLELYNTRTGSVRTGRYISSPSTLDGYAPDPAVTAGPIPTTPHTADTNRDGRLSLPELTRVIELYNTRIGTTRTGQYHTEGSTEDGFAPGP